MVRLGRQFPGKSKERQASQRRGQFEIPISPFFSVTLCRANWAVSIHRKRKNAVGYLNEIPLSPAQYLGSSSQKPGPALPRGLPREQIVFLCQFAFIDRPFVRSRPRDSPLYTLRSAHTHSVYCPFLLKHFVARSVHRSPMAGAGVK